MLLLTFTPTAVRPSRAFSSAITAAMLTFGTAGWQSDVDASVSAVNKTPGRRTLLQAVSVQSINFQDKHQIEKILFFPPRCLCREIVLFAEPDAQSPTRGARHAEPGPFWGSADFVFNATFKSSWEIPSFALLLRDSQISETRFQSKLEASSETFLLSPLTAEQTRPSVSCLFSARCLRSRSVSDF